MSITTFQPSLPADRNAFILSRLRNRLFDTSRRNRLLYYKPNSRFVNLTVGSVPMALPEENINPAQLFTWNPEISKLLVDMKDLHLSKYLHFGEHPYLNTQLNNVRLHADSDEKEYGFSQLKLVVAFLHWHNLKEDAAVRIQSPLLLLPVQLKRNKALKEEKFTLEIIDNTAMINPVLAQYLKDLYGITLPESINFDKNSMEQCYQALKAKIDAAEQGVTLHYIDQPRIAQLRYTARHTIHNYLQRLRLPGDHHKELPESSRSLADEESNPDSWDFDVCNLVLGNFNYKKMTLVSDYNQVAAQGMEHPVFAELFSNQPKAPELAEVNHSPAEWYHVISADPTQTKAILHNRTGKSYIIQGPPGTGKSQTITNLIADFLAQGKTILFVCEKRAALDVVHHRLQQKQLAELCCYIHDSQGDKAAFVKDLKTVYEDFLRVKMDLTHLTLRRKIALDHLQRQLQLLQAYHEQQHTTHPEAGIPTRKLIAALIQLKPDLPQIDTPQQTAMPAYEHWLHFGATIRELGQALEQSGASAALGSHPFRNLGNPVIQSEQPFTLMDSISGHAQTSIEHIVRIITNNNIPPQHTEKLSHIITLVKNAAVLAPLAESYNLQLIDRSNIEARQFEQAYRQYQQLQQAYQQAVEVNNKWLQKFSRQEVLQALEIAAKYEQSFFNFFSGNWRRLKKQLTKAYNFSAHQLPPAFSTVLQQLRDEYQALEKTQQYQQEMQVQYRVDNITTIYVGIEVLRRKLGDAQIDYLLQHPAANELVLQLSRLNNSLHQLELQLQQSLYGYEHKSLLQIQEELAAISTHAAALKALLPALRGFAALPADIQELIRKIPLTPQQAEAAMAHKTLQLIFDRQPAFAAINHATLQQAVKDIEQTYQQLLRLNSDYIRATRRQQFLQHYALSNTAASQLTAAQKLFKKEYQEGRRILEHEMGKTMRFRSIREMASNESGRVLKDIKPVWLMSPLSVSDSLPLDPHFFDVVIFDEASQIPIEEGIPALFRAPQTIIVGDDKQMPPSHFFNARTEDPDDLDTFEGESEEEILSTEADSLLVQGALKLPGTMLSWHYRSRYETLISYSNHAFYGAGLLTIPDKTIQHNHKPGIEIQQPEEGLQTAQHLLDTSISFHYLPNSIYERSSNLNEARYIAYIVKQLLLDNVKESIGIVAFSQEQQGAITTAINNLAATDRAFEAALENAYNRKDEGQFTGIFVKNLENVQGDERDIIIMSVCYGHDSQQKMLMNFGPVNRKGGEKRLNVIFSRAKKHMAVISSIKHHHITNDHNEGASYFKRFLHYAEMVSTGNMEQARSILDGLVSHENKQPHSATDPLAVTARQIKAALQAAGFTVDEAVGQSSFKCSLAVKRHPDDAHYSLGILLDDEQHYQNNDLVEQYYQRPAILQAFGWKTVNVYAKDWLEDSNKVLQMLLRLLDSGH